MIITRKQLADTEKIIGHSCEAGVLSGTEQGSIAIRVCVELPDGQTFCFEQVFTRADYISNDWEFELERFILLAKREFDKAFAQTGLT